MFKELSALILNNYRCSCQPNNGIKKIKLGHGRDSSVQMNMSWQT